MHGKYNHEKQQQVLVPLSSVSVISCDTTVDSSSDSSSTGEFVSSSTSSNSKYFDNAERTRELTWGPWAFRQFVLMIIKFGFCLAFYALQFQGHTIEADIVSHPNQPSLHEHLVEFRKESRTSRHEHHMLRSRQLLLAEAPTTDNDDEDDDDGQQVEGRSSLQHLLFQPHLWTPISNSRCASTDLIDPFPDSFDAVFYRKNHEENYEHYVLYGRENGWSCSRGQYMRTIIQQEILSLFEMALEIGPFINPMIRTTETTNVEYVDLLDWDGLVQVAKQQGYIASPDPIDITYVIPSNNENNDLDDLSTVVDKTYPVIVSSNVIGVQTNLVGHLQSVSKLLQDGGYYTIVVPDKRFSDDHFATETTIADVLQDHYDSRPDKKNTMSLRSLVEDQALSVDNDPEKNWHGEYRFPYSDPSDKDFLDRVQQAIRLYETNNIHEKAGKMFNVEVLQYHFTPHNLAYILDTLYTMGLTDLLVHRVYDTLENSDEFNMVLKKCARLTTANQSNAPPKDEQVTELDSNKAEETEAAAVGADSTEPEAVVVEVQLESATTDAVEQPPVNEQVELKSTVEQTELAVTKPETVVLQTQQEGTQTDTVEQPPVNEQVELESTVEQTEAAVTDSTEPEAVVVEAKKEDATTDAVEQSPLQTQVELESKVEETEPAVSARAVVAEAQQESATTDTVEQSPLQEQVQLLLDSTEPEAVVVIEGEKEDTTTDAVKQSPLQEQVQLEIAAVVKAEKEDKEDVTTDTVEQSPLQEQVELESKVDETEPAVSDPAEAKAVVVEAQQDGTTTDAVEQPPVNEQVQLDSKVEEKKEPEAVVDSTKPEAVVVEAKKEGATTDAE